MSNGTAWAGPVAMLAMALYRHFVHDRVAKEETTAQEDMTAAPHAMTTPAQETTPAPTAESLARFRAYTKKKHHQRMCRRCLII